MYCFDIGYLVFKISILEFWSFGDYPGLLIIPWFIFEALKYFIKNERKNIKLTSVSVIFAVLIIPLFFHFDFWNSPRMYIPQEWGNRLLVKKSVEVEVELPYRFKYIETEQLAQKARQLKKERRYGEAINIYYEAIEIEPENPQLLFDLADIYANINQLETAITLLGTAIKLDSTSVAFYNNRGLLYYKLNEDKLAIADYTKGIQLDSTTFSLYVNLAFAYYFENEFELACQSIENAEKLGYNVNANKDLRIIKKNIARKNNLTYSADSQTRAT